MKKLISNEEYHANEAVGSTTLKKIVVSTVVHALENNFTGNSATVLGSAFHTKTLTPETFKNEFIISPKMDKRTKAGKEAFASFQVQAAGREILNEDDALVVENMASAVLNHSTAKDMLTGGEAEYSYFSKCEDTGLELKCRPDYVNKGALIDLKSARDASPNEFSKACANMGYHIQAAYYLDVYNKANGTDLKEFYFIVVENTAPFAVAIYKMDSFAIDLGRQQYKKAINDLAEYKQNEKLEGFDKNKYMYGQDILNIDLPRWAYTA